MDYTCATFTELGFLLDVAMNFFTLRCYELIPMPFYLFFPTVDVIIQFIVQHGLYLSTRIYERTSNVIQKLKSRLVEIPHPKFRKYRMKQLRGIKPFSFHASVLDFRLLSFDL